jgi:hypothetical protein
LASWSRRVTCMAGLRGGRSQHGSERHSGRAPNTFVAHADSWRLRSKAATCRRPRILRRQARRPAPARATAPPSRRSARPVGASGEPERTSAFAAGWPVSGRSRSTDRARREPASRRNGTQAPCRALGSRAKRKPSLAPGAACKPCKVARPASAPVAQPDPVPTGFGAAAVRRLPIRSAGRREQPDGKPGCAPSAQWGSDAGAGQMPV